MYGPSAATGLGGATGVFLLSDSPLYAGLALFTLFGATFAIQRMAPALRRRVRTRRG